MATDSWQSSPVIKLADAVELLCRPSAKHHKCEYESPARLIRRRLVVAGSLLLVFTVATIWRGFLLGAVVASLVLLLQEVADPTPSVLDGAMGSHAISLIVSRNVRMNHFWLHRTQGLVRESSGCRGKLDGFATRDGFVLNGRGI